LIDGVYELVEIFDAKYPAQKKWKEDWLKKAREHGASSIY